MKKLFFILNSVPAFQRLLAFMVVGGFLTFNFSFAQAPDWSWAMATGNWNHDDGAHSVAVDASGNVYTSGGFQGPVDFDPGPGIVSSSASGHFISKFDAIGNFVWVKVLLPAWPTYTNSSGITVDIFGNIYVTGFFDRPTDFDPGPAVYNLDPDDIDAFILKMDTSGNFIWVKQIHCSWAACPVWYNKGFCITTDGLGNVLTSGEFEGTIDFDPGSGVFELTSNGSTDIYVSKLDSAGNFLWAASFGGPIADAGQSIVADASGNVYTTGYFAGASSVDFDPGIGTFYLYGTSTSHFIFISKLNSSGNFVWAKSLDGGTLVRGRTITIGPGTGDVYISGYFIGTVDFDPGPGVLNLTSQSSDIFISRLDPAGNYVWVKQLGGTWADECYSIAVDAAENVYSTGFFSFTADFDPGSGIYNLTSVNDKDMFVSKLDDLGNFVWAKHVGGATTSQLYSDDICRSLALDAAGNVILTGEFQSNSLHFGADTVMHSNQSPISDKPDIFIAKLGTALLTENKDIENSGSNVSVFPNPFTTQATISFGKEVHNATFSLYNLLGEKVVEATGISGESFQFNRGNLNSGVYVFEVVEKDDNIGRGKVVVY